MATETKKINRLVVERQIKDHSGMMVISFPLALCRQMGIEVGQYLTIEAEGLDGDYTMILRRERPDADVGGATRGEAGR